jgi:signal transduction histidine kinase/ActR/RegA family two-component response regulator
LRAAAVDDEHWKMIESIGFKSYICSPIRVRERVIGVLTLVSTNESDRTFTNTELTLVEDLCARAGTSVDNARLFREAQNLNQVKDEFLATLSHELRTPINVIQGNADIIVSEFADTLPPDVLNSLTAIQRNSKLQTQIVSDLLDVSSIITGKVTYVPQNVSPAEIVIAVCNAILPTAQAKRVAISYDTSAAPLRLMADPTRLHQILWNLLNNATKFTSSGGTVFVKASQEGELCVFKVQDTGMGIDPEFLPHVFDRFRQADSSMSRRFGGLGLGLSIVKSLSETHGGKVEVESAGLGKGTAFTVSLPIRTSYSYSLPTANYDLDATAAPVNKDISLDGVTVLLVEDSPDNRELVVRYLRKKGVTVLEAESASSAREILQRQRPDLILSDIGMPGENGIEFIKRFRSEWKGPFVPAIALTAYVRPEEIADALKAGFQAHVSKPVTPNSLISEIANTLKATPSKPLHA